MYGRGSGKALLLLTVILPLLLEENMDVGLERFKALQLLLIQLEDDGVGELLRCVVRSLFPALSRCLRLEQSRHLTNADQGKQVSPTEWPFALSKRALPHQHSGDADGKVVV